MFPVITTKQTWSNSDQRKRNTVGFLGEKWNQAFSSLEREYAQATPIASVQRLVTLESLNGILIHE